VATATCDVALLGEEPLTPRPFALEPAGVAAVARWTRPQRGEQGHACLEATGE
jgi:hypothetical protein